MTKTEIILNAIKRRDGMTLTEIQQLAALMSGLDWEDRTEHEFSRNKITGNYEAKRVPGTRRRYRGFWCTYLLGGMHYHQGILHTFCEKGADGKWRVVKPIEKPFKRPNPGQNFYF